MSYFRLLSLGMLVLMTMHQVAPTGKSPQPVKEGQAKNLVKNSDAPITQQNLESSYVRLFFESMDVEARKSLEMRVEKYLLSKHEASTSSSADPSITSEAVDGQKKPESELLARLHLAELKHILWPKNHNPLSTRFRQKASDEEVKEAKAKMRSLIGESMFLELEMRLPWVLRIELVERSEQLTFYEKVLSAPVGKFLESVPASRLHIPILFHHMLKNMAKLARFKRKLRTEAEKFWNENIISALDNNDKKEVSNEMLPRLVRIIYDQNMAFIYSHFGDHPSKLEEGEQALITEEHARAALSLDDGEQWLLNFIKRTRGALARANEFFAKAKNFENFLAKFWTEYDLSGRLMQEYILLLKAEGDAERLKAQMSADILVQMIFLDQKLEIFEMNEAIKAQWMKWRQTCLFMVDKLVDKDEQSAKDYGTLYKYMLYKLRNQQHPNKGGKWSLSALFDAEIKTSYNWKKADMAGEEREKFLMSDEDAAAESDWLETEHAAMLSQMIQENEEFVRKLEEILSTPQGRLHLEALLGNFSQIVQQQLLEKLLNSPRPEIPVDSPKEVVKEEASGSLGSQTSIASNTQDSTNSEGIINKKSKKKKKKNKKSTATVISEGPKVSESPGESELREKLLLSDEAGSKEEKLSSNVPKPPDSMPSDSTIPHPVNEEKGEEVIAKEMAHGQSHSMASEDVDNKRNEGEISTRSEISESQSYMKEGEKKKKKKKKNQKSSATVISDKQNEKPNVLESPGTPMEISDTRTINNESEQMSRKQLSDEAIGQNTLDAKSAEGISDMPKTLESTPSVSTDLHPVDEEEKREEIKVTKLMARDSHNSMTSEDVEKSMKKSTIMTGPENLESPNYMKEGGKKKKKKKNKKVTAITDAKSPMPSNVTEQVAPTAEGQTLSNQPEIINDEGIPNLGTSTDAVIVIESDLHKTQIELGDQATNAEGKQQLESANEGSNNQMEKSVKKSTFMTGDEISVFPSSTKKGEKKNEKNKKVTAITDAKSTVPANVPSNVTERVAPTAEAQTQFNQPEIINEGIPNLPDVYADAAIPTESDLPKTQIELADQAISAGSKQQAANEDLESANEKSNNQSNYLDASLWPSLSEGAVKASMHGKAPFLNPKVVPTQSQNKPDIEKHQEEPAHDITDDLSEDAVKASKHGKSPFLNQVVPPQTQNKPDIEKHQLVEPIHDMTDDLSEDVVKASKNDKSPFMDPKVVPILSQNKPDIKKHQEEPEHQEEPVHDMSDDLCTKFWVKHLDSMSTLEEQWRKIKENRLGKPVVDMESCTRLLEELSQFKENLDKSLKHFGELDELDAERLLEEVLKENEKLEMEKLENEVVEKQELKLNVHEAIVRLKTVIQQWDEEAFLLVTGSYQLGLYTAGSDIDCLVVLPHGEDHDWKRLYKEHFLGEPRAESIDKKAEEPTQISNVQNSTLNPSAREFQPSRVQQTPSGTTDAVNATAPVNRQSSRHRNRSSNRNQSSHRNQSHYTSPTSSHANQQSSGYQGYQTPSPGGYSQQFGEQQQSPGHFTTPEIHYIQNPLPNDHQEYPMHQPHPHHPLQLPIQQPQLPIQQPQHSMQQPQLPIQQPQLSMQQPQLPMQQPQHPMEHPQVPMQQTQHLMQQPQHPMQQSQHSMIQPQPPMQQSQLPMQQSQHQMQQPQFPMQQSQLPMQQPQPLMQQPQHPMQHSQLPMHQPQPPMQQPQHPMQQPLTYPGHLMLSDYTVHQPSFLAPPQNSVAIGFPVIAPVGQPISVVNPLISAEVHQPMMVHAPQFHDVHVPQLPYAVPGDPSGFVDMNRRYRRSPTGNAASTSGSAKPEREEKGTTSEEISCEMDRQKRKCPNESLYCVLCRDNHVKTVTRIPGRIPLLKAKFHGFDFDLVFVTFPQAALNAVEKINAGKEIGEGSGKGGTSVKEAAYNDMKILRRGRNENDGEEKWKERENERGRKEVGEGSAVASLQSVESVDQLTREFVDAVGVKAFTKYKPKVHEMKIRMGMLLSLSGYRANLRILELLSPHSMSNFRLAMLTLKLWAKRRFVAGGQFGLLNGTTLTILFVNSFLRYPEATVPALLVHFFKTYSQWNWPTPIELEPSAANAMGWRRNGYKRLLDWSAKNEEADREAQLNSKEYKKLVWPVLTPGLPRQNAAFNINSWTTKIIEHELKQSLTELQNIQAKIENSHNQQTEDEMKTKWVQLLNLDEGIKFEKKYDHYLAIVCTTDLQHGSEFCDYVESRIRLQLLIAFDDIPQVEFMHANPEKVWHNTQCPQQIKEMYFSQEQEELMDSSSSSRQPHAHKQIPAEDLCTLWLVGIQMQANLQFGSIPATLSPDFIAQQFGPERILQKFAGPIRADFQRDDFKKGMSKKLLVKYYSRDGLETLLMY